MKLTTGEIASLKSEIDRLNRSIEHFKDFKRFEPDSPQGIGLSKITRMSDRDGGPWVHEVSTECEQEIIKIAIASWEKKRDEAQAKLDNCTGIKVD